MIDALVTGKLHTDPESRTSKNGKPYAIAKLRAAPADGEAIFVSIIAFAPEPCRTLLALQAGDSVAVSGSATPKAWIDREGEARTNLDVVASQVMTAYTATKKRKAIHPEASQPQASARRYDQWQASQPGLDDGSPLDF